MPDLSEKFCAKAARAFQPEVFFKAASTGDYKTVEALLEQGAEIEARDKQGRTALSHAAGGAGGIPHPDVVKLLLGHDADPNSVDDHGNSVLIQAALTGDTGVIGQLLKKGADVNHCGKDGTALMAAAWICNERAIALLIDSGADVSLENEDGETAKCYAATMGNPGVVWLITRTAETRDALLEIERAATERTRIMDEIDSGFSGGLAGPVRIAKPLKITGGANG